MLIIILQIAYSIFRRFVFNYLNSLIRKHSPALFIERKIEFSFFVGTDTKSNML